MIELERATDRRTFFLSIIYGAWAVIAAALGVPAFVYLFFPPRAKKAAEWTEAGQIDQLEPNIPQEVVFRRTRMDGWKVFSEKASAWVIKDSANHLTAFAPQCTHLGCAYHFDDQKQDFVCPCHSSVFAKDGRVLAGPAPRPLDRYDIKLDGNKFLLGAIHKSGEKRS